MAAISSPCIRICVIDEASGLCEGCGRTLAEIATWGTMAEAHRTALMADLPRRLKEAGITERPAAPPRAATGVD
ncbi:DUF1289 domain-containing protein [Enterovirga rhinocerotis]|uniref:Fe-S protein YdhL (DUF1289 family) n=1 Tax=Enterovirga rhinocerotis TaxID=1339210 RepID=A0A4R7BXH9_9HYPH|nr:DUF1289 domain-containing protein [Enterovirga rhinocerotis]TDR89932.1 hypothetical protein EV668_2768 [Enterovirga rhinocerotis]